MGRGDVHARARAGHINNRQATVAAGLAVLVCASAIMAGGPALAAPSTPDGTPPAPTAPPAARAERAEDAAALRAAKTSGKPAEIESRRTEDSEVFRHPSGAYLVAQHVQPVRVRRGSRWVAADPTLRVQPDGSVKPVATVADLTLSGGGTGPFVSLQEGGARVALSWPKGPLPRPVLAGDSATYRNVLPDVDLKVTARVGGFSEVFVVKTPKAAKNPALAALKLKFDTAGVTVHTDSASDTLTARNAAGKEVFRSATPMMWGRETKPAANPATANGQRASSATTARPGMLTGMDLRVGAGHLTVVPGERLRNAPASAFPINIDPDITVGHGGAWTTVVSGNTANSSFWGTGLPSDTNARSGNVKVGKLPGDGRIAQSYFRMPTGDVAGKIVEAAEFQLEATHAWNCAGRPAMRLALSGPIDQTTTWNRKPAWHTDRQREPRAAPCPTGTYKYDVTDLVQLAAEGRWGNVTFGLRAQDETNEQHWRRFRANGNGPTLWIRYREVPPPPVNRAPDAPADLSTPSAAFCGTESNPARVGAGELRFTARLTDPDGDALNAFLDFTGVNGHYPPVPQTGLVASGTVASFTMPASALQPNVVYAYHSRAHDSKGAWGPFNQTCYLVQDTTPPDKEPQVSSADYPSDRDRFFGSVGKTGEFTFGNNGVADVSHFLYGTQDPPATRVDANNQGAATVEITPSTPGPNTVYVRSVDGAGNRGPIHRYTFNVKSGTAPVGWWRFDEGAGGRTADTAGNGHAMTVANGGWSAARGGDVGRTYYFNGASTYGEATGPVLDTTKSFTISAWANPYNTRHTAGFQAVVGPTGANRSPFVIGMNTDTWVWELRMSGTDAAGAAERTIVSPSLHPTATYQNPGLWYHLAATYDSGSDQVRFYVDGVLVGAMPYTVGWNATGPLQVGRSKKDGAWGNHFDGRIDDVRVWQRVALPDEVLAVASDGAASKVPATAITATEACTPESGAEQPVDGSSLDHSKWCTFRLRGFLDKRSMVLKLATETTLRSVTIRHAGSGGDASQPNTRYFDIEAAVNDQWVPIGRYENNTSPVTVLSLPDPVRATQLRIVVYGRGQQVEVASRILHVDVHGSAWELTNVARGATASSPDTPCTPEQTADKLTDGYLGAPGWCSEESPQTAQVDLGAEKDIRWIVLRHAQAGFGSGANTRHYNVEVSSDGTNWSVVSFMRANTMPATGHAFARPVTARYVRIPLVEPVARLAELEIYASV